MQLPNDLDNSVLIKIRSAEMIASNSTTNGLDNSLVLIVSALMVLFVPIHNWTTEQLNLRVTSTNENKSYKEDVISDRIIKKKFEDTALSVKIMVR